MAGTTSMPHDAFLSAAGGVRALLALPPFSRSFVAVSEEVLEEVSAVERELHSAQHQEQKEALLRLCTLLGSGTVSAEVVPNTIAERLGELIAVTGLQERASDERPELEEMLDAAIKLSAHESHVEVWESMDLHRWLGRLASSEALEVGLRERISALLARFAELKGRDRTKTYQFTDDEHVDEEETITIDIRQLRYTQVGLAYKVWDSGLLLSSFIFRHRALFRGKRILELGSGCGLAGLVMAHYAANVILTDYIDEALENIRSNFAAYIRKEQNRKRISEESVVIHRLDWTDSSTYPPVPEDGVDIIIGSDVVYDQTAAHSVPRVVHSLLHPRHGVAIIVLPAMRMGVAQFEENMRAEGMHGHKWVIPNRGNDDALHFYIFSPSQDQAEGRLILHQDGQP